MPDGSGFYSRQMPHYVELNRGQMPGGCPGGMIALGIGHFTVVCLVTWPLSGSEAGGDLVLIQTLLLFICKCKLVSMRTT